MSEREREKEREIFIRDLFGIIIEMEKNTPFFSQYTRYNFHITSQNKFYDPRFLIEDIKLINNKKKYRE